MTTVRPTPEATAELAALIALAERAQSAGRLDEAVVAYRQILTLRPDVAEVHNSLGSALYDQGKLPEARQAYERALALKPGLFQACNNLGNVLRAQGQFDQAVARYEQAITCQPEVAETHNNLGNVLLDQGKLDEAAVQFERTVALDPSHFQAHNDLGCIFQEQGKLDQGVAQFEKTIALRPDLAEPHNNLAGALKQQGKLRQAAAHYDQAIALKPDFAEAHYDRTDLKTFRPGDAELGLLEALAADPGCLPPHKMLYIHFALGKALEDTGDYPRAFQHWLQGNALKRQEVRYNEAACQQAFQLIAEVFDTRRMNRLPTAVDPAAAPIFVLGMPRSGSTVVEQILASHPQVHAAGELTNLDRVIRAVCDTGGRPIPFPQSVEALDANGLRRLGQAYLASLPKPPDGRQRITDKAPGNYFLVGLIRLILPGARIIHTQRDPVDTCVSCFSRLFTNLPFSYDLAELGRYYRAYHALMAHWRSVLPAGAMLDVKYEDVVGDLEEQARRLIDYCGLPWDDRCLSFHQTSRSIATPSNVQVRRPIYRSSVQRWRRYEAYLQPLLAELASCRPSA